MNLKDRISNLSAEAREAFAKNCGTSRGHMQNVAYGYRSCSPELAVAIERETAGTVTRQDLRPADWQAIWPELAEQAQSL